MNRIRAVQNYLDEIFDSIADNGEKRAAYIHSYGVAQSMALLALKRNLNVEIATIIGLLHDVYTYKTGVRSLHSHNGAEMIRVAFKNEFSGLFTEEEQTLIKSAVYHHSDKSHIHDAYDELLKDCDILQHYLYDVTSSVFCCKRLERVAIELGIDVPYRSEEHSAKTKSVFMKSVIADIAESLAAKNVTGKADDVDYMGIIKYYPEKTAFAELDHAWCAAFVYHCCIKAGLTLPLRTPHTAKEIANCRFACVVAWYEWAKKHGYCRYEKDGYAPERGDIVVYNNIIPSKDKPENAAWCDHIGVVLSCANNKISVAEGNIGNKNTAGIIRRSRDNTIGCYIRIPENYEYTDWMIDFKTGSIRTEIYN